MYKHLQVFRENLADWIKHPHLRETLTGAIVRVALNTPSQPGGEGSMCRITDVVDGAPYSYVAFSPSICTAEHPAQMSIQLSHSDLFRLPWVVR